MSTSPLMALLQVFVVADGSIGATEEGILAIHEKMRMFGL